ncbi:MAG: serine/threonine-protein kinase [Myxococcales bacterium]
MAVAVARQSCPNCGTSHDVSVYVSGQRLRCRCGLHFEVRRMDVPRPAQPSAPRAAAPRPGPAPSGATARPEAAAPAASAPSGEEDGEIEIVRGPPAPRAAAPKPVSAPAGAVARPEEAAPAASASSGEEGGGIEIARGSPAPPAVESIDPAEIPEPERASAPPPPVATPAPPAADEPQAPELAPTAVARSLSIPGYELIELLGRGGMGEVWKARQVSLGRLVAIKALSSELARHPDFVRRFEKEAAALASLSHPGIVQIIDRGICEQSQTWFFVMELCEGEGLRERMNGPVAPREAARLLAQVCRAIDYAHQRGVIHRDLKPENILVGADGQAKIVDFGLAGMPSDERMNLTQAAVAMGTLHYMAPEQRSDARSADERADLYALGVILYEMLVGEVPVGRFKLPSERCPGLDPRFDRIVARALEPDPEARYQSAAAMAADLEALQTTAVLPAAGPEAPLGRSSRAVGGRADSKSRRAAWLALAALVALGALFALARAGSSGSGLPGDTMGTLGVTLARSGPSVEVGFKPGRFLLHAYSGAWSLEGGALVARVFGRSSQPSARPYALLDAPEIGSEGVELEAEVTVDPEPPAGYEPGAPARVELAIRGADGAHLGLGASFGPSGRFLLTYRAASGEEQFFSAGADQVPEPGRPLRLRLAARNGEVEASAGSGELRPLFTKRIGGEPVSGKVALLCSEATCRFSRLRLAKGQAGGRPSLAGGER